MVRPPPTISLFAKFPTPGAAKTRLAPALGDEGAAQIHRLLVERTIAVLQASGLPFVVRTTGAEQGEFANWLGADFLLEDQGTGDLGARLARVVPPAIVLGADIPDLEVQHLHDAAHALEDVPVVIGPARDGGYYLLGFREDMPFLWGNMAWGTETVLKRTEARLEQRNIAYRLLETLDDCDRPEDLSNWPDLVP